MLSDVVGILLAIELHQSFHVSLIFVVDCYSSRSCRGDLLPEGPGKSGCCVPGGGLSFRSSDNTFCQECFSKIS